MSIVFIYDYSLGAMRYLICFHINITFSILWVFIIVFDDIELLLILCAEVLSVRCLFLSSLAFWQITLRFSLPLLFYFSDLLNLPMIYWRGTSLNSGNILFDFCWMFLLWLGLMLFSRLKQYILYIVEFRWPKFLIFITIDSIFNF